MWWDEVKKLDRERQRERSGRVLMVVVLVVQKNHKNIGEKGVESNHDDTPCHKYTIIQQYNQRKYCQTC